MSRPAVTWETTKRRHGTPSGANLHARLGEPLCDACYVAKATYERRQREDPERKVRARLNGRAQTRAERALARWHPDEYRALYLAAKADLEWERDTP